MSPTDASGGLRRAHERFEKAAFEGDLDGLDESFKELDLVEAELCLARGRLLHARFLVSQQEQSEELDLFARAVDLFRTHGDRHGEAEGLFWLGTYHQVVRKDTEAALPPLRQSYDLATLVGDKMTLASVARHLGFAASDAGDSDAARTHLEESLRLRREAGHGPSVAAALLALAEVTVTVGNRQDVTRLLDEAASIAAEADAGRILAAVEGARADLDGRANGPNQ